MPLAKRVVGETGSSKVPTRGLREIENIPEDLFQNDVLSLCQKLISLVRHADDLFDELYSECDGAVRRTCQIRDKVRKLTDVVLQLDAKEVAIPRESDLSKTAQTTDQHRSTYGYDCRLFVPSSRPECLRQLHRTSDVNPTHVIRQCDLYRTDGKSGSDIFSRPLTVADEKDNHFVVDVLQPMKTPIIERTAKSPRQPKCTRHVSESSSVDLDVSVESTSRRTGSLPTPDDRIRQLSYSQPVLVVPVDVSGVRYRQICENRRSSRSRSGAPGANERQKRAVGGRGGRGKTVSEEERSFGFILSAHDELRKRNASRERWDRARGLSQELTDPSLLKRKTNVKNVKRKKKKNKRRRPEEEEESKLCSWTNSLCSLFRHLRTENDDDLWIERRPGAPAEREIVVSTEEDVLPFVRSQSLPRSYKSSVREPSSRDVSVHSLSSDASPETCDVDRTVATTSSRRSLVTPRSSVVGSRRSERISAENLENLRPRRHGSRSVVDKFSNDLRSSDSARKPNAGVAVSSSGREVIVHLPEQPWTKPFATVKLRPQSERLETDRNQTSSSSSGDSACHSMHSDQMNLLLLPPGVENRLRLSLDKDSAFSDVNPQSQRSSADVENRYAASIVSSESNRSCRNSSSTSRSATKSSQAADDDDFWSLDDKLSLYSVDQDGFYTSMHADSGLSKSNNTLTPGDEMDNLSDVTISTSSVTSFQGTTLRKCDRVVPNEPRGGGAIESACSSGRASLLQNDLTTTKEEDIYEERHFSKCISDPDSVSAPLGGADDVEAFIRTESKRLEAKTSTNRLSFPSFCAITPSNSDSEENEPLRKESTKTMDGRSTAVVATLEVATWNPVAKSTTSAVVVKTRSPALDSSTPSNDPRFKEEFAASTAACYENHETLPKERRRKCARVSLTGAEFDGFSTWPMTPSLDGSSRDGIKGILKSNVSRLTSSSSRSKCINFGPTTCLDGFDQTKMMDTSVSSDRHRGTDLLADGRPEFLGSSFLGDDAQNERKVSKLRGKKLQDGETKRDANGTEPLPSKYRPVIVVRPKNRAKDSTARNARSAVAVDVGHGHLGTDAIITCADIPSAADTVAGSSGRRLDDLEPAPARLVITSPVTRRTTCIENPHKRSLCFPVAVKDLEKFSNYSDPERWFDALPRKASAKSETADGRKSGRHSRKTKRVDYGERYKSDGYGYDSFRGNADVDVPVFESNCDAVGSTGTVIRMAKPGKNGRVVQSAFDAKTSQELEELDCRNFCEKTPDEGQATTADRNNSTLPRSFSKSSAIDCDSRSCSTLTRLTDRSVFDAGRPRMDPSSASKSVCDADLSASKCEWTDDVVEMRRLSSPRATALVERCSIGATDDSVSSSAVKSSLNFLKKKQSFESDSSGLGSSTFGSPLVSPDNDDSPSSDDPVLEEMLSLLPPPMELLGSSVSPSPDVIPLMARTEYSSLSKNKNKMAAVKSKQTSV